MRFLYVLVIAIFITGCKNPLGVSSKADSGFLPGLGSTQPPTEATKLDIVTDPQSAVAGQSLGTIQVRLLDDSNTLIPTNGFTVSVAIQNNPGSSTIIGTASQITINGVATFNNLALNRVGTAYTLTFSGGSLASTTSQNFDISVAALSASTSTLSIGPTSVVANDTATSTITATLRDAYGNPIIGETVTFASTGTYNTIVQPAGVTNSSGVATGTIRSSQGEVKTISFSAPLGLSTLTSNITFTPYASQMVITTEPQDALAGQSLGSIQVQLRDLNNNAVTTSGVSIMAAIQTNPGTSTLSGTTTQTTVNGIATFSNLSLNKTGTGYTLAFSSTGLSSVVSQSFNISPAAISASQSTIAASPTSLAGDGVASTTITATIRDAYGNAIPGETVTFASTGTGNTITQPAAVTNASGVATGSMVSQRGQVKTVSYSAPSALTSVSTSVTFTEHATQLAITTEPASALAGASLGSIQVQLRDGTNSNVSISGTSITVAIQNNAGTGTLSGTTTRTTTNGVATFSGLSIDKMGTGYTLIFTSTGLTSVTSQAFNISPAAISATQSTLVLNPTTQVADNTSTSSITLTLRDAYDNPISGQNVVFAATGSGNTIVQPASVTNSSGVAAGTIRSSVSGTKAVSVTTPSGLSALTTNIVFGVTPFTDTFLYNTTNTNYTVSTSTLQYTSSTLAHKSLTRDASNIASEFAGALSNTNVEWNGSNAMRLSSAGLTARTGNFESRIMSAPAATNWTSFEWQSLAPAGKLYPSSGTETGYASEGLDMSNLSLLLRFDEASWSSGVAGQVIDSSPTGNHGTATGVNTGTVSRYGRAMAPTANGQIINIPHNSNLDSTQVMSWEAWIYPTFLDGNPRPIISKRLDSNSAQYAFALFIFANNRLNIDIAGTSNGYRIDTGITFSVDTWYHVVATYNGALSTNRLKVYINGTLSSQTNPTATSIPATNATSIVCVGCLNGNTNTFRGSIDELAVYERVLTQAEITSRFNRGSRRIKFQARACNMSNCSDGTYVGPDGTASTFFTEEQNTGLTNTTSVTLPGAFNNKQYFQYRATLESTNGTTNPQLQTANAKPDVYDSGYPTVTNVSTFSFLTLTSFNATESGTVRYQISRNGTDWYYYNSGWVAATLGYTHTNTKDDINTNISTFPTEIGTGNFYVRAFYDAGTGATAPASLTSISVSGGR